jgi:flagellar biosynthesis protein FliR
VISFTSAQLDLWLAAFFWPFFRILALVATAPLLGAQGVPATVKVGIAFVLTVVIAPVLGTMPAVQPASAYGLFILMQQVMIGIAMGLAMQMVFTTIEMAGHIMGLQMGLGFATFFDPQNSSQVPVLGQFLGLMAMLLFLAIDGHLMMITALVQSFNILPIGLHAFSGEGWHTLVLWGGEIFRGGMMLSLPAVAVLMMTNVALAVLTRAAPQLNIFAVGFPVTMAVGFIVIAISLGYFFPLFATMFETGVQMMLRVVADANTAAAF